MITPNLEFVFSVRLEFPPGPRLRFPLPTGESRGFVPILVAPSPGRGWKGRLSPQRWRLAVVPRRRVVVFDARYLLRARDGG